MSIKTKMDENYEPDLFDLYTRTIPSRGIVPDRLFHYTSIENVKKIIDEKDIRFRFSSLKNQEDKNEGKSFYKYYVEALMDLLDHGILSKSEVDNISELVDDKQFFFYEEKGIYKPFSTENYDVLIICFTSERYSGKMIENYIKNPDHKGAVLEFDSEEFFWPSDSFFFKGHYIDIRPVLYGKDAVIQICEIVKTFKDIFTNLNSGVFDKKGRKYLGSKLSKIKYYYKDEDYRPEKEYRIMLPIPLEYSLSDTNTHLITKYYISLRRAFRDVKLINLDEQEKEEIEKYLIDNQVIISSWTSA